MSEHVVCFEARGNSFGSFHNNVRSGLVVAIKLEHVYGHIRCISSKTHDSHWGCANVGKKSLNVVLTDQLNRVIFPKEHYIGYVEIFYKEFLYRRSKRFKGFLHLSQSTQSTYTIMNL